MKEAEANVLKMLSKMTAAAESPMTKDMRKGALGSNSVIEFAVAEVTKENSEKAAKKMTEIEADALKIFSKQRKWQKRPW